MRYGQRKIQFSRFDIQANDHPIDKNKDYGVIHAKLPAKSKEVRHFHRQSRQIFFMLVGNATIEVDGEVIELKPLESCEIPPRVAHQIFNKSDEEIAYIITSQPNSHGDYVIAEN